MSYLLKSLFFAGKKIRISVLLPASCEEKGYFHDGSQRGIRQYKTAGASSLKLMGEQAECVGISFEVSEVIPFLC